MAKDSVKNTTNMTSKSTKGGAGSGMNMVSSKDKKKMNELVPTLKKLYAYIGEYNKILIFGLILAASSSIFMLLGPNLVGKMTNTILAGLGKEINITEISRIGVSLATIYIASALFTFIQHYMMAGMTAKICKRLRKEFSEKVNKVPQSYYNTHIQGDILSCITNDVQTIRQGLSRSIPNLIRSIAQFFTCLIIMFFTE